MATDYIDVDSLKDYLGIDHAEQDETAVVVVPAASRAIDVFCDRRFWADTTATVRYFDACSDHRVKVDDFHSTSGLVVAHDSTDDGTYDTTWTASDYELHPINGTRSGLEGWPYMEIRSTGTRTFPMGGYRTRVSVTALWGWTAVPEPVTDACLIWAARLYRRAQSPEGFFGGAAGFDPQRVSNRIDPDIALLLNPYRKEPLA